AEQMDRLLSDDAGHRPAARLEHDPLADEDLGVPAADFAEPQETVVVDVGDDQADLVDVPHEHEPPGGAARTAPPADARDRRAHHVHFDVGEAPGRLEPGGRGGLLVARRARHGEKVVQQRRHGRLRAAPARAAPGFPWLWAHAASSPRSTY